MMRLFLFSFLIFLFSCASKPIQYHAPRKNSPATPSNRPSPENHETPMNKPQIQEAISAASSNSQPTTTTAEAVQPTPFPPAAPTPVNNVDYLTTLKTPNLSKKAALEIIDMRLTADSLEKAAADQLLVNYRPQILWRWGQLTQKDHHSSQALQIYRSLATQYPGTTFATSAQQMASLLEASENVDAKVIGALLPLTGKNANVGQHTLNAIRMGLGLNESGARYRLAIFDTQSLPETAGGGVDKLIRDDKAIALIGGLSSKEATIIAQRAELLAIPFIGLSQKSNLTATGEFIFRNSLTPEMQVDELVQFATTKLSARRFAILYPNDSYGVEFSNIFWDHVLARNGQVVAAQAYDPKENNFTDVIRKLVGTYYVDARPEEFRERQKELKLAKKEKLDKNKAKKNSREHEVEENILPPVVDFDVLFLPDTGKTLGQVMAFMKVGDVPKMTYLGTNIWNTPDIVKRAGSQAENIYFVEAVDLNDQAVRDTAFFKDYTAQYNEEPTLIEMQAFESAKILRDVTSAGATTRELVASRLRSLGRSSGVTGELRMSNMREIERPIHVFSLDKGIIKKVE